MCRFPAATASRGEPGAERDRRERVAHLPRCRLQRWLKPPRPSWPEPFAPRARDAVAAQECAPVPPAPRNRASRERLRAEADGGRRARTAAIACAASGRAGRSRFRPNTSPDCRPRSRRRSLRPRPRPARSRASPRSGRCPRLGPTGRWLSPSDPAAPTSAIAPQHFSYSSVRPTARCASSLPPTFVARTEPRPTGSPAHGSAVAPTATVAVPSCRTELLPQQVIDPPPWKSAQV